MGAFAGERALVDTKCVAFDDLEPVAERLPELAERGHTAPVALDGDDRRARDEQGARQAPRTGTHFINALALERAGDGGDTGEELSVEDEILAQRLARAEAMTGDDVAQGLRRTIQTVGAHAASER